MHIVLSQKVDTKSTYKDQLFQVYHYPVRYQRQIHEGDSFIYYQSDQWHAERRYYFGTGKIGDITAGNDKHFYARLLDCKQFEHVVPIHMGDGYVETLGYSDVRRSPNPPWQNSIRGLSEAAYEYILAHAGTLKPVHGEDISKLRMQLKNAFRGYYLNDNPDCLREIHDISDRLLGIQESSTDIILFGSPMISDLSQYLDECRHTPMTYSYKAAVMMAVLSCANEEGASSLAAVVNKVHKYFILRKRRGEPGEKASSILSDPESCTVEDVRSLILHYPVNRLANVGLLAYNKADSILAIPTVIWNAMGKNGRQQVTQIWIDRLEEYFRSVGKNG